MKTIYKAIYALTLGVLLSSCEKQEEVEVVSLSTPGDEFYFGERVVVYAPTIGEKDEISYKWTADSGYFLGSLTQNLFENLWVAPAKVGTYNVSVTAMGGKATSTRSREMKVTRYFFDDFQSPYTFAGNGWIQSNTTNTRANSANKATSRIELTASSTSGPNIRRNLDLAELKIPFSIQTKLGWTTFFRANQAYTISLFFRQPLKNLNYPYIREIRWEVWPTRTASGNTYQLRFETVIPAVGTSLFTPSNTQTASNPVPRFLINPVTGRNTSFLSTNGQMKTLTFSVDANEVFTANIDGTNWVTSNGLKEWLTWARATYPGFEAPIPWKGNRR
jgi:hypothetical protein